MNRSASLSPRRRHLLAFEALEARVLFDGAPDAPVADVQVSVAEEKLINQDATFTITFDNTGTREGYAPYVDFIAPAALQIQSATTFGAGATNPSGSAVVPIGRIAADGQLVHVGTGVPVDHPMYAGASDGGTYGRAGSGTSPVLYNVAGNPSLVGMYVYSAQLPFGSYTPGNPAASVQFTGSLEKANGILPHQEVVTYATGGFAYGADALHNPVTDSPVSGNVSSAGVSALIMDLAKTALVPEEDGAFTGENVSGPNHPVTHRLTVNLAAGEKVTNLMIRDVLPDDLAYKGNVTVTFGAGTSGSRNFVIQAEPELNTDGLTAVDPADNELRIVVDQIIGQGGGDIVVTYTTFVPYREVGGQLVVQAVSGQEGDLDPGEYDDASVTAWYDPDGSGPALSYLIGDDEGPMQPGTALRSFGADTDFRIEEHSLAIQKGVGFAPGGDRAAAGASQGDVLQYSMNFQISDYFAFDQVVIDDLLGDGQEFLPGDGRLGFDRDALELLPQLTFNMHGASVTVLFDSANFQATENPNGTTSIHFDVYQQLVDSGFIAAGAPLLGGFVESSGTAPSALGPGNFNGGATTGTVTFRAKVREAYQNDFVTDSRINQGDVLRNTVTITGRNLDIETFAPLASVSDGSAASISIPVGGVTKQIHSVTHAGTVLPAAALENGRQVVPGDVVTWKLTYQLPISEFEALTLTDYLPMPIFNAGLLDTTQVHAWNPATFNTAGRISFGPGDTFFGTGGPSVTGDGGIDDATGYLAPGQPTITVNPAYNSFTIHFGDYVIPETASPVATTIEIYVSTLIQDGLYADGLLFTNQVEVREQNSNVAAVSTNQIAQIDLTVPELRITKGIVAASSPHQGTFTAATGPAGVTFNAPGSSAAFSGTVSSGGLAVTPLNSDLNNLDAGDVVTFAITLENSGSGTFGAFDVRVSDALPAGFVLPGALGAVPLNLRVTDGTGASLAYTILGGGTAADFFVHGLELTDPSAAQGSIAEYDPTNGRNVVIIAYDLVLADSVQAASSQTNTATLQNYSYREGGLDYATAADSDSATVNVLQPMITKSVVDTSHDDIANQDVAGGGGVDQAAVGEVITYEVTVTVPEGEMTNVRFRDTLPTGLAFLALDSVTASAGLSLSAGGWGSVVGIVSGGTAGSANQGTVLELGFGTSVGLGTLTNSNRDNTVMETVVIRYRAVVTNVNSNDRGDVLQNEATLTWQVSGTDQSRSASDSVTIVEPLVTVTKDASASSVEGDDLVTYTLVITNLNQANVAEAYDLVLEDLLPAGVSYAGALTHVSGVAPDAGTLLFDASAGLQGTVRALYSRLGRGQSSTLSFQVRVDDGLNIGTVVSNTVRVSATSLPGTSASATSYNSFGVERTGDSSGIGGAANDYQASDPASFTVVQPTLISKTVVDTSEEHTGADATSLGTVRAAIGEVVRFAVTFEIPQANSPSVQLVDTLDSRLFWLGVAQNNVQIRFDGFDPSGSTLGLGGDLAGANGTTIALDPSRISFDAATNRVTFALGDLLNTELDTAAPETVTILYNAVVRNAAAVDRGDVLLNSAQLRANGVNLGTPLSASVTVVEPVLTVTKTDADLATADAGDVIDYRIRVSASAALNATTAFDLVLTDSVPAGLEILSGTLIFSGLPAYVVGGSVSFLNQDITASVNELRPGDFFDVLFQARVRDSGADLIQAGERIENTALLTFSSLPSDGTDNGQSGNATGSESGTPGSAGGERIYNASGSDFFSAPVPVLSKVLGNPADLTYTIGETVEYVMTLTVPEGRTGGPEAYILDAVQAGLSFVPGSLSVTVGNGITIGVSGLLNEANGDFFTRVDDGSGMAELLRFDFGHLDFNRGGALDGLASQTVEIRYRLSIDNLVMNQAASTRNTVADFYYTDDDGTTRNLASDVSGDLDTIITIVEPVVGVDKQIVSIPTHPDAGDTVAYRLVISHTGTAQPFNVSAYDLTLRDVLPAHLVLDPASFTAVRNGTTDVDDWFQVTTGGLEAVAGAVDLAPGDQIVISYDATISSAVRDGDLFLNRVDIEWTTLDGVVAGERGGDGDLDNPAGPSNPNDYEGGDSVSFAADLTPVFAVTKEIEGTSAGHTGNAAGTGIALTDLVIGETVTYRITATIGRGTTDHVRLVDVLSTANGKLHILNVSYTAGAALRLASGDPIGGLIPALSDASGADGYIDRVELNFGTVINDPALSLDPADEQIILLVEAVVVNDAANQQGDVIRNTGTLHFDDASGSQSLNGSVDVEILEPAIGVVKTVVSAPPTPQAGDLISYQIELVNSGGADAFEVDFADVVPVGMELDPASFSAVRNSDSLDVSSWFAVTSTGITTINPLNLAAAEGLTLTYGARILTSVPDGFRLTNESNVTWTSLPAGELGARSGNGTGPNDYEAGDAATVVANLVPVFSKTVLSTSAGHTGSSLGNTSLTDLVIGETVTYELAVQLGRGTTHGVVLEDLLDLSRGILDLRAVRVEIGGALTATIPAPILTDSNGDGFVDQVRLDFGTVVNDPAGSTGSADEQIRVFIDAVVVNVLANQGGDVLTNTGRLTVLEDTDGDGTADDAVVRSSAVDVEIHEPVLQIAKTIPSGITQADAEDVVGYRVVISQTSAVEAFDLTMRDVLPAQMELLTGTFSAVRTSDGADLSALFTVGSSGVSRSGNGLGLVPGDSIVILYEAKVLSTVTDGLVLNTRADLEWSTIAGTAADERTGDQDFDSAVGPANANDQENGASRAITAEISPLHGFAKSVLATSAAHTAGTQVVVGETVTFQLTAQIGRGTNGGVVLEDILALGNGILDVRAVRVEIGGALTATIPAPILTDSNGDGFVDQVRLDFGTVVNDPAGSTGIADEQIRVFIDAVVVNVLANQGGDLINNTGRLTLLEDTDGDGNATEAVVRESSALVELVEPQLTLTKTIEHQPIHPDAGDLVSYQVILRNTSAIDAFDVRFQDVLSANLALKAASFVAIQTSDGADVSGFFHVAAFGAGADSIVQAGGGFTLAAGEIITLTYDAVIRETVQDGDRETNRADLEWTTTPGSNADERGGDGDPANPVLPGNPNDHEAAAETTFTADLTGYGFEKSILSTSHVHTGAAEHDPSTVDLAIGETVVYELRATFAEGTTTGVILTDIFDGSQAILQPESVTLLGGGNLTCTLDPSVVSLVDDDGDGFFEKIVIDLGTVVNDAGDSSDPAADELVVRIQARVVNRLGNHDGDQVVNQASFTYARDANHDGTIDSADAPAELTDEARVELVEPRLTVDKTVDDAAPRLGQVLTYTLTIVNGGASTADAFDVAILDRLADGLILDPASVQIFHLGAPVNPAIIQANNSLPGQLRLVLNRLDQGDSVQITYRVQVTSALGYHDAVLSNEVDLEWTSLPGTVSGERGGDGDPDLLADPALVPDGYEHGVQRLVEVFQPDLTVVKDDAGEVVRPGQPLVFTLTVTNQGRSTAHGVTLTDDLGTFLDQGFRVADLSDGGVRSGDIVTWSLPDLAVGETRVVTLTLQAPAVLPARVESVTNTAVVTHQDLDPTPGNNQDEETSPVLAWPDLTVSKDDALAESTTGDLVTYTIFFDNVGDQTASGVVITDTLPPGVEFVSATGGGTHQKGLVIWNLGELPPHGGGSVQVTVRVMTAGLKVNNVVIADDSQGGADPSPENNLDSDETLARQRLRFDLNQNFLFRGGNLQRSTFAQDSWRDQLVRLYPRHAPLRDTQIPVVLATHMNSGLAQPGSTITLEVYNARGERIGEQSVVADAGGNWLATFNTRQLDEVPSRVVMKQTWAAPNPLMQQGYNYRTYFASAFTTATYYTEELTVWNVTEKRAATEVLDLYDGCECILRMDWNNTSYELHARGALQSSSGN